MAIHAPLTEFLARLNTDLGAGTGAEFLAATGRRLVAAHVLPEEEFSRQGQPNDSDLGSLLRTLHSLGPAVNWAGAATVGHASKMDFFASVGLALGDAAKAALLARGHAAGSGTIHEEVDDRKMLSYKETQQTVAATEWQLFVYCVQARDFAGAQGIMASGSEFAKNLKRASLFAAKSISKAVPKQEPCRSELNGQLHAFEQLSGELIRTTVLRCLPDETTILAPAIKATTEALLGFVRSATEKQTGYFMTAAGIIAQQDVAQVKMWKPTAVQQGLRITFQILEVMIGPPMGVGCADRAITIMNQWGKFDDRFTAWAAEFKTPSKISPAWHFAKEIILAPTAKWLSELWLFWCGPHPNPGTLHDALSEASLRQRSDMHQLMKQHLMRISTQAEGGETSESDLEIEEHLDSGDSDCDSPPPKKKKTTAPPKLSRNQRRKANSRRNSKAADKFNKQGKK